MCWNQPYDPLRHVRVHLNMHAWQVLASPRGASRVAHRPDRNNRSSLVEARCHRHHVCTQIPLDFLFISLVDFILYDGRCSLWILFLKAMRRSYIVSHGVVEALCVS